MEGFVPDCAIDVAAAYPRLFKSPQAVRQAFSRRGERAFECDGFLFKGLRDSGYTQLWLRVAFKPDDSEGNRRNRTGGWMRMRPGDTPEIVRNRVRAFLPDASDIEVIFPRPPQAEQLVERAREAVQQVVESVPPVAEFLPEVNESFDEAVAEAVVEAVESFAGAVDHPDEACVEDRGVTVSPRERDVKAIITVKAASDTPRWYGIKVPTTVPSIPKGYDVSRFEIEDAGHFAGRNGVDASDWWPLLRQTPRDRVDRLLQ
jgi:hypothetical protein